MAGELIGIVNAKSDASGAEGLGFAIPINDAIDVAQDLLENGYVSGRPYLGITYVAVTDEATAQTAGRIHLWHLHRRGQRRIRELLPPDWSRVTASSASTARRSPPAMM